VGVEYLEFEQDGETVLSPRAVINRVSHGIGVDHEGRIWSLTHIAQPDPENEDRNAPYDTELLRFEVFESSGALLGSLPVPETCIAFRVVGDRLLLAAPVRTRNLLVAANNQLLVAEYPDGTQALLAENSHLLGPELLEIMQLVEQDLAESGRGEVAQRLAQIQEQAAAMIG